MLTEGNVIPIGVAVDGANRHDMKTVEQTIRSIPIERPAPTTQAPRHMPMDKGYDYPSVRELAAMFSHTPNIVPRGQEAQCKEAHSRISSSAVGGGADTHVDEPVSSVTHSPGEEGREPRGDAAPRLYLDRYSRRVQGAHRTGSHRSGLGEPESAASSGTVCSSRTAAMATFALNVQPPSSRPASAFEASTVSLLVFGGGR